VIEYDEVVNPACDGAYGAANRSESCVTTTMPSATDIVMKPKEKAMYASVCFFISYHYTLVCENNLIPFLVFRESWLLSYY
jgi:hypothetical protein